MRKDTQGLHALESKSVPVRIALVSFAVFWLVFLYFAGSWQLGNMIASITEPTAGNAKSVSEIAFGMSPRDPMTNWLAAVLRQDENAQDVAGFEKVVLLSPYDYRWWGQLGRAYEQADKAKEAEAAFKRSAELAPNYVFPQWQLGNFYLRAGNEAEAIMALQKAAEIDPSYREQVFSIVWDFYEQDSAKLEALAGNNADVNAGLAKFYAAKGLPEKSLEMWKRLSNSEQQKNSEIARLVAQALYDKGFLKTSVQFINQLGIEKGARIGAVHNPGFETGFSQPEDALFSWNVPAIKDVRVQLNGFRKHGGKRSLEVSFNSYENSQLAAVYQTIAVSPGTKYRLSFWVKTQNLVSRGMPVLEVINFSDKEVLASSKAFQAGTNEWQNMSVEFTVPADSEGVSIRTAREYCGEKCLLTGTFWYDDFQMTEVK